MNRIARIDSEMQLDLESNEAESVQRRTDMALAHLHRIDPETNMARFYCIDVAATLFGDVSVLRTWGRIGTHGQTRLETCDTVGDAQKVVLKTLRRKLRRGYLPAGQCCRQTLRCEICQAFR